MLHFDWLKEHKKEILFLFIATLVVFLCLLFSSGSRNRCFIKDGNDIIAIVRENPDQSLSLPMEVEVEKDGQKMTCEVILSLKNLNAETGSKADTADKGQPSKNFSAETVVRNLADEIEAKQDLKIPLPEKLEDGTRLRWKDKKDFRFLLVFLLFPGCLLYIYEGEKQKKKQMQKNKEEEIRRALPSFLDQLLLLLNCGMIFHDAFYRIEANYAERNHQDAFGSLLHRIGKEAKESGAMIITVMKGLSQDVAVREYVRLVNILMDHQHRGINLEEKLQAESRLLWEGRKAAAMQKGKEMETKMTFPLALLLLVLIIIAGMPALMNI